MSVLRPLVIDWEITGNDKTFLTVTRNDDYFSKFLVELGLSVIGSLRRCIDLPAPAFSAPGMEFSIVFEIANKKWASNYDTQFT